MLGVLSSLLQLLLKVFDLFLALPVDFALDEDLFNLLDLWLTLRPLRDPHDRQRPVFCTREEKCLLIIELELRDSSFMNLNLMHSFLSKGVVYHVDGAREAWVSHSCKEALATIHKTHL